MAATKKSGTSRKQQSQTGTRTRQAGAGNKKKTPMKRGTTRARSSSG